MSKIILIMKQLEKEIEYAGLRPCNRSNLLKIYQEFKKGNIESFIDYYKKHALLAKPINAYRRTIKC